MIGHAFLKTFLWAKINKINNKSYLCESEYWKCTVFSHCYASCYCYAAYCYVHSVSSTRPMNICWIYLCQFFVVTNLYWYLPWINKVFILKSLTFQSFQLDLMYENLSPFILNVVSIRMDWLISQVIYFRKVCIVWFPTYHLKKKQKKTVYLYMIPFLRHWQ